MLLRLRHGEERLHRGELGRPFDRNELAGIDIQPGQRELPAIRVIRLGDIERPDESRITGVAPPFPGMPGQFVGIGHGIFAGNRGDYVQGTIAELGLINRVLTATEVSNLYAAGRAGMGGPDAGVDVGTDVGPGDAGPPDAPTDSPAGTDGSATDAAATDAAADGG